MALGLDRWEEMIERQRLGAEIWTQTGAVYKGFGLKCWDRLLLEKQVVKMKPNSRMERWESMLERGARFGTRTV